MAEDREPPYEGGSQPVGEERRDVPHGGRGALQTVVLILAALALIAALIWVFIPLG